MAHDPEVDKLCDRTIAVLAEHEARERNPRRAARLRALRHRAQRLKGQHRLDIEREGKLPCPVCGHWSAMDDLKCPECGSGVNINAMVANSGVWKLYLTVTLVLLSIGVLLMGGAVSSTGVLLRLLLGASAVAALALTVPLLWHLLQLLRWVLAGMPLIDEGG